MSEVAIRVESLSKQYRIGTGRAPYKTIRESLTSAITSPLRRWRDRRPKTADGSLGPRFPVSRPSQPGPPSPVPGQPSSDGYIWALKDVSFDVNQGEVVGIIGRNGAGKTTLLKVLSRITKPTEGRAEVHGRVGSLLEVGTGFHPELTGRENIYLNGAILGMKKAEIHRKFDEIVAFAEVEKFIDTPVKHYSSGMYVRLAFAVAAHLEPEILLVDEVLAVGDAAFQKKCLGKMGDVAKGGRTVLFVSHNMAAVQSLCVRALWLHDGQLLTEGTPSVVIPRYLQTCVTAATERVWDDRHTAPGNDKVRLRRAAIRPADGSPRDPMTIRTPVVIEFEYWNLQPEAYLNLSLHVYNGHGIMVFNAAPVHEPVWHGRPFPAGLFRSACHVPGDLLNDGIYRIELLVVENQGTVIHLERDVLTFEVEDAIEMRGEWHGKWPGAVRPDLHWTTELVETGESSRGGAVHDPVS